MTAFQSLLITFLVVLTVLNILRKRRKKQDFVQYRQKIDYLKDKAKKDLKNYCSNKLLMYPFMSDCNDYYLIGVEEKKDLVAIITEGSTYRMKISSEKKCETVLVENNSKQICAVISRISCSDLDHDVVDIYLSRKTYRKNSYFCKLARENSEVFNSRIMNPLE